MITNKGKHTPGIDKVVWETDEDKSKAIEKLDTSKYHAQPLRRVYIEKYGKKKNVRLEFQRCRTGLCRG